MDWTTATDGDLIAEYAANGDDTQFAELVRRHRDMVHRTCRRITGSDHDADDVTQAVFAVLAKRAASLDRDISIGGWLYSTAWHVATRQRRSAHRRMRCERSVAATRPLQQQPPANGDDVSAELSRALNTLPEKHRDVIIMYHFAGMKLSEIAGSTGEPIGTVAARLSRARGMLRDELARRGIGLTIVAPPDAFENEYLPGDGYPSQPVFDSPHAAAAQSVALASSPAVPLMLAGRGFIPPMFPILPGSSGATSAALGAGGGAMLAILPPLRVVVLGLAVLATSFTAAGALAHASAARARGSSISKSAIHGACGFAGDIWKAAWSLLTANSSREFKSDRSIVLEPTDTSGIGGGGSVPEPATAAVVGGAAVAMAMRRPRRAQKCLSALR